MKIRSWVLAAALGLSAADGWAEDLGPWTAGFSIGMPQAAGQTKDTLESGFGLNFNFGWRPPEKSLGFRVDVIHASFDLSDATLRHIDSADSGYAAVWGIGASALITPKRAMRFKPYFYAGPGMYLVTAEVTRVGT